MLNSGCEKETLTQKQANDVSINSLTVNENGIIEFKNSSELHEIMNQVISMTEDELDSWEKTIGFYSYRSMMKGVVDDFEYMEKENVNDEENFRATILEYVKSNSDILKYSILDNGEESIDFIMPYTPYLSIINEKGVYIVGDIIYLVGPERIYYTHKNNANKLINKTTNLNDVESFQYIGNQTRTACGTSLNAFYDNGTGCNSGRRVILHQNTYISGSDNDYIVYIGVNALAKKRVACVWFDYKTDISIRYIRGDVYYKNTNGIVTHKVHNGGTMCITLQNVSVFGLSTPLDNCSNSMQPYFQSCHSEAGTTGTNNGWAVIDCE